MWLWLEMQDLRLCVFEHYSHGFFFSSCEPREYQLSPVPLERCCVRRLALRVQRPPLGHVLVGLGGRILNGKAIFYNAVCVTFLLNYLFMLIDEETKANTRRFCTKFKFVNNSNIRYYFLFVCFYYSFMWGRTFKSTILCTSNYVSPWLTAWL